MYIILNLIQGVLSIILPLITGSIVDYLNSGRELKVLLKIIIIYGSCLLIVLILNCLIGKLYVSLQMKIGFNMNKDVVIHIQNSSFTYINNKDVTALTQKINNDTNEITIFCLQNLSKILVNIIMSICLFLILFHLVKWIALVILNFIFAYVVAYTVLKGKIADVSLKFKEDQAGYFSKVYEQLAFLKLIKYNSANHYFIRRWCSAFVSVLISAQKRQTISNLFSFITGVIDITLQIIIYLLCGVAVIYGEISIGIFITLISYVTMLKSCILYFYSMGKSYQEALASYKRIKAIIETPILRNGNIVIDKIKKIKLSKIKFSFNNKTVINNINIIFKTGNIYTLIGPNGAGKTTLLDLMMGIYGSDYEGEIIINDTNIKKINMRLLRKKHIGITEQEPQFVADSIYNNMCIEKKYNEKKISFVLRLLNMYDFVHNLPLEINTPIEKLSGGEKQKLAIARVLLKKPSIMIFDEPTSALDLESSVNFLQYLQKIKKDRIIIIVTHDEKIISQCDFKVRI